MCVVVRFVCLFVGSCATLLFYVVNTLSWGWKWCQQFFGSHQFSVTLSTKDFPHHSALVFYFIFIFYVPVGLGTIVPNVSVCDIELKHSSYVHASQVCWWEAEVNLVWEKHSGAIVLEKKINFFSPSPPDCGRCALLKSHECLHLKWRWWRLADYSKFLYVHIENPHLMPRPQINMKNENKTGWALSPPSPADSLFHETV